jgi:hypothetical protein
MSAKPVRRWYQFSLRALIVLTVITAVPLAAYVGYQRYLVAKRLAEIESSFQWLESLGYARLENARPVRVTTRQWYGDQDPLQAEPYVQLAFLIDDDDESLIIFTPALETTSLPRRIREEWHSSDTTVERIDMRTIVRAVLDRMKAGKDDPFFRFGHDFSERGELFVLAWVCARNGYPDWAIQLYGQAEASRGSDEPAELSLQELIAADIAHMETWRATLAFQSPLSRPELLKKFRWLERNFPKSEHAETVAKTAAMLETMVAEDERHAQERRPGLPFEELTRLEQIAELIFQLRDQQGYQWSQPGSCDVLNTHDGADDSPGHKLVEYGYAAIPQLAAALDDERLTRSVGFHRDFYFSHTVLTVGDAAEQILHRIAGRRFDDDQSPRDSALAWHAELMAKGERQALIEAVERGDETSVALARRLLKMHPDEACSAILAGISRGSDDHLRLQLVELLGRIHSDESVPFLLEEMEHTKASHRLAAAEALTRLGRPEGIDAMLREWQSGREFTLFDGAGPLLAGCGRPDALVTVARRFSQQTIDERLELMDEAMRHDKELLAARPELCKALIDLLLVALADTEVRQGMGGSRGSKSFSDPRVCDLAGYHLNCLDAAAFPFDLGATYSQREAERLAILKRHGD